MNWQELTALLGAVAAVIVAVTGLVSSLRTSRQLRQHMASVRRGPAAVPPQRPGP